MRLNGPVDVRRPRADRVLGGLHHVQQRERKMRLPAVLASGGNDQPRQRTDVSVVPAFAVEHPQAAERRIFFRAMRMPVDRGDHVIKELVALDRLVPEDHFLERQCRPGGFRLLLAVGVAGVLRHGGAEAGDHAAGHLAVRDQGGDRLGAFQGSLIFAQRLASPFRLSSALVVIASIPARSSSGCLASASSRSLQQVQPGPGARLTFFGQDQPVGGALHVGAVCFGGGSSSGARSSMTSTSASGSTARPSHAPAPKP